MTEIGKQKTRDRMIKFNPMKNKLTRRKVSIKLKGHIPWNKGLSGVEYKNHFKGGIVRGGRKTGYTHSCNSKKKMSEIRLRMLREGTVKLGKKNEKDLEKSRDRMRKNRKDPVFNQKMFSALTASVTKPHVKIQKILKDNGFLTTTNKCFLFGKIYGSIDEVIEDKKIAIFIDGNYWHNYPKGRKWDKYCTTFLEKRGWRVIRFWESDINNNIEWCTEIIKSI